MHLQIINHIREASTISKIDFSKYKDIPTIGFQPFGDAIMDTVSHAKWDLPEKVGIVVAPTGAFVSKEQNPSQPIAVEEIIRESIESVEAGACSVHVHVRDENGFPSGNPELTEKVVKAIRDKFGGSVHIDGEALFGEDFEETVAIARLLDREPMTGAEYREATGMKPF